MRLSNESTIPRRNCSLFNISPSLHHLYHHYHCISASLRHDCIISSWLQSTSFGLVFHSIVSVFTLILFTRILPSPQSFWKINFLILFLASIPFLFFLRGVLSPPDGSDDRLFYLSSALLGSISDGAFCRSLRWIIIPCRCLIRSVFSPLNMWCFAT